MKDNEVYVLDQKSLCCVIEGKVFSKLSIDHDWRRRPWRTSRLRYSYQITPTHFVFRFITQSQFEHEVFKKY